MKGKVGTGKGQKRHALNPRLTPDGMGDQRKEKTTEFSLSVGTHLGQEK